MTAADLLALGEHPADVERVLARLARAVADDDLPSGEFSLPVTKDEE